jgi:hypothetical protein
MKTLYTVLGVIGTSILLIVLMAALLVVLGVLEPTVGIGSW